MKAARTLVSCISAVCLLQFASLSTQSQAAQHVQRKITLKEAVAVAKEQNPQLQMMRASADEAKHNYFASRALRGPQVSVSARATEGNTDNMLGSPPGVEPDAMQMMPARGSRDANAALSIPVFTGGEIKARIQAASSMAEAEDARFQEASQKAAADAAQAYFKLIFTSQTVTAAEQLMADETEQSRIAGVLYETGKAPKFYMLRAKADLARAEQELEIAQSEKRKAEIELAISLGYDPSSSLNVDTTESLGGSGMGSLEQLRTHALTNRPAIAGVNAERAVAEAEVRQARSSFSPKIYGSARYDLRSADDRNMAGYDSGFMVGITASLPLFDAGLRKNELQAAHSRQALRQAHTESIRIQVLGEVEAAFAEVLAADKNVKLSEASIASAEENYSLANVRFKAGKGTQVEVLDALSVLADARKAKAQRVFEHNAALVRLKTATGSW